MNGLNQLCNCDEAVSAVVVIIIGVVSYKLLGVHALHIMRS